MNISSFLNLRNINFRSTLPLLSKEDIGMIGSRHVLSVDDGWIVGFNAGEFGGGLWWFNIDGSKRKKLLNKNIIGLTNSSTGVLVLVGLAHMSLDSGEILRVE